MEPLSSLRRRIEGIEFERVGVLTLKRNRDGGFFEYVHRFPEGEQLHKHAPGPFCVLELQGAPAEAGVYALLVEAAVAYVGECANLRRRFGAPGYGAIAPRNCLADGQATNCKVNTNVLKSYKDGRTVEVWFHQNAGDRWLTERHLLTELRPPWNEPIASARRRSGEPAGDREARLASPANLFRASLRQILVEAERRGLRSICVRSGDLHRKVGGYPGRHHRMPECCRIMRGEMTPGDRIVESPLRDVGASLVVEYQLPRRASSEIDISD
jgi:5-methylcytosine-specific restriction protein A